MQARLHRRAFFYGHTAPRAWWPAAGAMASVSAIGHKREACEAADAGAGGLHSPEPAPRRYRFETRVRIDHAAMAPRVQTRSGSDEIELLPLRQRRRLPLERYGRWAVAMHECLGRPHLRAWRPPADAGRFAVVVGHPPGRSARPCVALQCLRMLAVGAMGSTRCSPSHLQVCSFEARSADSLARQQCRLSLAADDLSRLAFRK